MIFIAKASSNQFVIVLHSFIDTIPDISLLPDWDSDNADLRTLFLVFPFVEKTLQNEISLRASNSTTTPLFTEPEILSILRQLVLSITELNQKCKIVHRDLKPDNVFVEAIKGHPYCRVMIGDFGEAWFAKEHHDLKCPYPVDVISKGGNPGHLAPEIRRAVAGRTNILDYNKNDLYAVGIIGLELAGAFRYDTQYWDGKISAEQVLEKLNGCSEFLKQVLKPMVAENQLQRGSGYFRHYELGTEFFFKMLVVGETRHRKNGITKKIHQWAVPSR